MKTIDCPDCGGAFAAASREQKRAWMEDFERRWSAAKEMEA
jgi:hypothetical protein